MSDPFFAGPGRVPPAAPVIYLGQVTRVDAAGVYVLVPRLIPDHEFGPLPAVTGRYPVGGVVLLGQVEDRLDDLAILGPTLGLPAPAPIPRADGLYLPAIDAPTSPTAGGTLYVQAGALKYRGAAGTVTTLAVT